jgi:hypothetical protein
MSEWEFIGQLIQLQERLQGIVRHVLQKVTIFPYNEKHIGPAKMASTDIDVPVVLTIASY